MAINSEGIVSKQAVPVWTSEDDGAHLPPMVVPDGKGPWALRYLWVRHRTNNDDFVKNYFNGGNNSAGTGLNLRKQTSDLSEWKSHNEIFETSKNNGNLVWRVKVFNPHANSIDYVEVWRSPKVLAEIWGKRDQAIDSGVRSSEDVQGLKQGIYGAGFELRWFKDFQTGWPLVTKRTAMSWYKYFVDRFKNKDNCIINTPWNKDLNPLLPAGVTAEQYQQYLARKEFVDSLSSPD